MNTQTLTVFQLTEQDEEVLALGRKHHWRFRLITDFRGVIDRPVFSSNGDWLYSPLVETDKPIIPKAAFSRHAAVAKAGFHIVQVIIGHEVKAIPDESLVVQNPLPEIDWANVAKVAGKGIAIGMMGMALIPLAVLTAVVGLTGAVLLADPSYCIVLSSPDNSGSVIELLSWNTEVKNATKSRNH